MGGWRGRRSRLLIGYFTKGMNGKPDYPQPIYPNMPQPDLTVNPSPQVAIKHARLIATSLQNEASQRTIAVARFALARVVMLLEPLVVPTCT